MGDKNKRDASPSIDDNQDNTFRWSNLIFLPFHHFSQLLILLTVLHKTILGPITAVFPIVSCMDVMNHDLVLILIKHFYQYVCDAVYAIDTVFHIIHRQVTDEALKREYLPKNLWLILLDIISVIPFFDLANIVTCPETRFYPNVLKFSEVVVVYRVAEYFSIFTTHSYWNMFIGFMLLLGICINAINCFVLLLTIEGLCDQCTTIKYLDWRSYVQYKWNETSQNFGLYAYGTFLVISFLFSSMQDETKANTLMGLGVTSVLLLTGFTVAIVFLIPKMFAEHMMRLRRYFYYLPKVHHIVTSTQRRNPPNAHEQVECFYSFMWKMRKGVTCLPDMVTQFPRGLSMQIKEELIWPIFYHSPTLRSSSSSLRRWIFNHIHLDSKLPGENFFSGPQCLTRLYYIKSGVVQLISADDGITPLLSVSGGTIIGDISFYVPALKKKTLTKCLSYCEVFYIARGDVLRALHMFPEDRKVIISMAVDRLKHARTLYNCKLNVRGLDRSEDEGVAWFTKRWWQIHNAIKYYKKTFKKGSTNHCIEIPDEETNYHCAKYIGQIVLCTDVQLQEKTLFAKITFPWMLVPNSRMLHMWYSIVKYTVFAVLIAYPLNLSRLNRPVWFRILAIWAQVVYVADICISLMTSIKRNDDVIAASFTEVLFERSKTASFYIDILATLWLEEIMLIIGKPNLYDIVQFNRLLKIYILFQEEEENQNISVMKINTLLMTYFKIVLSNFVYKYLSAYVVFMLDHNILTLSTKFFYGKDLCNFTVTSKADCDPDEAGFFAIVVHYTYIQKFGNIPPSNLTDLCIFNVLYITWFIMTLYLGGRLIVCLYLSRRSEAGYRHFVISITQHYIDHNITKGLLTRVYNYLVCHWNYLKGLQVIYPNILRSEPYDIFWKAHGEPAAKIIGESAAFTGADNALVRDLANKSKFFLIQSNCTLMVTGMECINIMWVVKGVVRRQINDDEGKMHQSLVRSGELLSLASALITKKTALTLTTVSDCEILYVNKKDFMNIMKRYPNEYSYFMDALSQLQDRIQKTSESYIQQNKEYRKMLREQLTEEYQASVATTSVQATVLRCPQNSTSINLGHIWVEPDSAFIRVWMPFRVIVVIITIVCAAIQGGSGASIRQYLLFVQAMCNCISMMDMVIKFIMAYYNEDGLLIYETKRCAFKYLTSNFVLDLIGALPWYDKLRLIPTVPFDMNFSLLCNTIMKFSHIYMVLGHFNYLTDHPRSPSVYLQLAKYQIIMHLCILGVAHYLMTHCVEFTWDELGRLLDIKYLDTCWMPQHVKTRTVNMTMSDVHEIYAQSINYAQCGLFALNFGKFASFKRDSENGIPLGVAISLLALSILYWYILCQMVTRFLLRQRGVSLFLSGITQMTRFLRAERANKSLIAKIDRHFRYWFKRSKGINIDTLMNESFGVVFKQDLSYFFYKSTLTAACTILPGLKQYMQQLTSTAQIYYYLGDSYVLREMDLETHINLVHRGKVSIWKNGEKLATLTKGCIFGQLTGRRPRPSEITILTEDFTDILSIPIRDFQDIISEDVNEAISQNPTSKYSYLKTLEPVPEDPYNTVKYLLRERKSIYLPWMKGPQYVRDGKWYSRWLTVSWLLFPALAIALVVLHPTLPAYLCHQNYMAILFTDLIHLMQVGAEYFTTKIVVKDGMCVAERLACNWFKKKSFYIDVIPLIEPIIRIFYANNFLLLLRILRFRLLFEYYQHFCQSNMQGGRLKRTYTSIVSLILFLHILSCGWICIACRNNGSFPIKIPEWNEALIAQIDSDEWVHPKERNYEGCARFTPSYNYNGTVQFSFVVPLKWYNDYVLAMLFMIILFTRIDLDVVSPVSIIQVIYKIIAMNVLQLIVIWVASLAISTVYMMMREMYYFDFMVSKLIIYLNHNGSSQNLIDAVLGYSKQLWVRQKGNWLPQLIEYAPISLRGDILMDLYGHHFHSAGIYRDLPDFFLRQLATRLKRIVIFPNKTIVHAGDISSVIYFIHEGDVEQWSVNNEGDEKLISVLTTCGYFGLIPSLYPTVSFTFRYVSRTVVDLVFLRFREWQDLLGCYPDVKESMYRAAAHLKRARANKRSSLHSEQRTKLP